MKRWEVTDELIAALCECTKERCRRAQRRKIKARCRQLEQPFKRCVSPSGIRVCYTRKTRQVSRMLPTK